MSDARPALRRVLNYAPWTQIIKLGVADPYALWSLATHLRAFKQAGKSPDVLTFVIELPEPYEPTKFAELLMGLGKPAFLPSSVPAKAGDSGPAVRFYVPAAYEVGFKGVRSRFITLRLTCENVPEDARERAVSNLVALTMGPTSAVSRLQIGHPRGVNNADMRGEAPQEAQPPNESSHRVVLGVIEDSGPFAHAAVRADGPRGRFTRVVALWDQTSTNAARTAWSAAYQFRYGRQLEKPAMDMALARYHDGYGVDEDAVYADPGICMPLLAQRASHGAAVLPLMAGAGNAGPRMSQQQDPDDEQPPAAPPADDAAARAPIVAVHLPVEQTKVSSGRWLAVNALDGLRYIDFVARNALTAGSPPPLVVNMSYGAIAGPHDGTGMLETAIDELADLYQRAGGDLAVVLAAGNAHGVLHDGDLEGRRVPGGVHARATIAPAASKVFTLFIPPDKQGETHVEIWFDRLIDDPGEAAAPAVQIVVTPPCGAAWPPVACNGLHFWPADADEVLAGLLFFRRVPQGLKRSMALLAVAATQISSSLPFAPPGRWRIEVFNLGVQAGAPHLDVQAWVERDDTTVGARRPQSARFVDMGPLADHVRPDDGNTFTNIATGSASFAVGALRAMDSALEGRVSTYSAEGSGEGQGPEFSAVADAGLAVHGIRVSGSQSGMVLRGNGTSIAAPQAARWIANQLAHGRSLDSIRTELAQGPRDARRGRKDV